MVNEFNKHFGLKDSGFNWDVLFPESDRYEFDKFFSLFRRQSRVERWTVSFFGIGSESELWNQKYGSFCVEYA